MFGPRGLGRLDECVSFARDLTPLETTDDVCEACVVRPNRMLPRKRCFILECGIAFFLLRNSRGEWAASGLFLSFLFRVVRPTTPLCYVVLPVVVRKPRRNALRRGVLFLAVFVAGTGSTFSRNWCLWGFWESRVETIRHGLGGGC